MRGVHQTDGQRRHKNWGAGLAALGDDADGSPVRSEKNEQQETGLEARCPRDVTLHRDCPIYT